MNERSIEIVREYHFDPKEVIKGLNGYYESDKRNSYITVRRNDAEAPAYLTTALYLSALIEWLREDFDIFYRPGLIFDQIEAARNAAKMCGLRAHIKDEISKRGLWCGADADIPELVDTLFKAYDECGEHADKNRKEVVKLSKENRELKEGVCEDIMKYVRQEASRNGFELSDEVDGEPINIKMIITVKRVFHDLLELLRKRTAEIKEVNDQRWKDLRDIHSALGCYDVYDEVDDFLKAVKARAAYLESLSRNAERETRKAVNDQLKKDTDYVADVLSTILEALGISKSDTVHLDVFGLKTKAIQRAACVKSEHDRYLEQLDSKDRYISDRIRSSCKAHGVDIDAGLLTTSDWQQLVTFLCSEVEKLKDEIEEKCKGQAMVTRQETKQECYKYLWDAIKALNPDCDALKITDYEKLIGRIFYEMSLVNDRCKRCWREHTNEKFGYIQRTNKAEEEVKKLKEQKDRSFVILQDLYRDIFKKQPDGLSAEDIATKILDKVLKTEDLLHKSVDSVNKECKATGKLMIADYEKDLLQFICKEYKDRIGLSDNTITYNPPSVRNTVLKIISDYARSRTRVDILETQIKSIFDKYKSKFTVDDYLINADPSSGLMLDCFSAWFRDTSTDSESRGKIRAEIENYKLKLKDYILKDINEHGYRYGGLEKKSIEEIVDWIITMATCPRNEWANCEIKKLRDQIDSLKGLINAMNEEVKDM